MSLSLNPNPSQGAQDAARAITVTKRFGGSSSSNVTPNAPLQSARVVHSVPPASASSAASAAVDAADEPQSISLSAADSSYLSINGIDDDRGRFGQAGGWPRGNEIFFGDNNDETEIAPTARAAGTFGATSENDSSVVEQKRKKTKLLSTSPASSPPSSPSSKQQSKAEQARLERIKSYQQQHASIDDNKAVSLNSADIASIKAAFGLPAPDIAGSSTVADISTGLSKYTVLAKSLAPMDIAEFLAIVFERSPEEERERILDSCFTAGIREPVDFVAAFKFAEQYPAQANERFRSDYWECEKPVFTRRQAETIMMYLSDKRA